MLGDAAEIHHHDVIGDLGDDAQIVGDEHDGHAQLVLQVLDQIEDHRLRGHVERRGGLIGDEELGLATQTQRDHRALPHAAREFERVGVEARFGTGDADAAKPFDGEVARLGLGDALVDHDGLADLLTDGLDRPERGHRLLEDHADLAAPDGAHLATHRALRGDVDRLAGPRVIEDAARHDAARPIDDLEDRAAGDGLAAAGFADNAECLAARDREGHAVERLHHAFVGEEVGAQVLDLDQRLGSCIGGHGGHFE